MSEARLSIVTSGDFRLTLMRFWLDDPYLRALIPVVDYGLSPGFADCFYAFCKAL